MKYLGDSFCVLEKCCPHCSVQHQKSRESPVVDPVVGLVDISPRTKIKKELGNIGQLGPGKYTFH